MIRKIIKTAKVVFYKYMFRKKNVKIDWSCNLAAKGVLCEGRNVFHKNVSYRGRIGYGSFIGENCDLKANIGRYCSIGKNVRTESGTHPTRGFVSTHPCFYSTKKQAGFSYVDKDRFSEDVYVDKEQHVAVIGNDVWIGSNVLILPGVHISDGAIVAAGAVVAADVEPYTIVGGVPAKIIRKRFTEQQISELLEIQWWNWPESRIREQAIRFDNIDAFLENKDEY